MKKGHQLCNNDLGNPIIETFENENVIATHFILTGETEIKFKRKCDKRVIKMYKQLMKPVRRRD